MSIHVDLADDSERSQDSDTQRVSFSSLRDHLNALRSDLEGSQPDRLSKLATLFPANPNSPDIVVSDQFAKYLAEVKAAIRGREPHTEFKRRQSMYDTIPYPADAPRYRNVTIGNVNLNVENLNIESLHVENMNIQINIAKVDVLIGLFEDIRQSSVAERLRELQIVAQNEIRSKSVLPDSARTMFNLFNLRSIERPVIGIGNDGMLEARWDNEDYTLNIMARFFPGNQIWYALFDHANDQYHHETVSVPEMVELISSYRPIPGLVK